VIKNVEQLCAELQVEPLGELGVLQYGEVPVVDARTMKESPIGVALLA
jgi:hypothetical protein